MRTAVAKSIDDYISQQAGEIQSLLQVLRETIKAAAPEATEVISYGMPAFRQNGILVYFAACKGHIGFYPTPGGISEFKRQWKDYKTSKGAVQLPFDGPLPVKLIAQVVRFRLKEDLEKAKLKRRKR
jgi:uncharacterized protein YdhG (YjbR/CyaY superfamily)